MRQGRVEVERKSLTQPSRRDLVCERRKRGRRRRQRGAKAGRRGRSRGGGDEGGKEEEGGGERRRKRRKGERKRRRHHSFVYNTGYKNGEGVSTALWPDHKIRVRAEEAGGRLTVRPG